MKYLLILQMMTFPVAGGAPNISTYQESFKTEMECQTKLEKKIDEWQKVHETSSHVGIIGKCVEQVGVALINAI